ncbi:PIG-X [Syncephalis fuscata]|nr:PIG-X [Syncephalis fuscata]
MLGGSFSEESTNEEIRVGPWPTGQQTVSVYTRPKQSFHPVLHYDLSSLALAAGDIHRPAAYCEQLVMYQPLPAALFADPYQLHDVLEQGAERVRHYGQIELENPVNEASPTGVSVTLWDYRVYRAGQGGSKHNENGEPIEEKSTVTPWKATDILELPLHGRYQVPLFGSEEQHITVHSSQFYWLCHKELTQSNDHLLLSKDSDIAHLFNDKYAYQIKSIQVTPTHDPQDVVQSASKIGNALTITLPSGRLEDASIVALGTLACVTVGLVWIIWAIFTARQSNATKNTNTSKSTTEQQHKSSNATAIRVTRIPRQSTDAYDANVEKDE